MGMVYGWKPNVSIPVDAQVAGEELEKVRVKHNGRLTQQDVVEAAKPRSSPLHAAFEWNDHKAAQQWRLEQAGYMIRSITVRVAEDRSSPPVRAFVNVQRDEDRSYTSLAHAMSDAELRQQILARAWKELEDWRKRYDELIEFARVFAVIEEIKPPQVA